MEHRSANFAGDEALTRAPARPQAKSGGKASLPGKRLPALASFVRAGVRVADIGTDHALLPVYLVQSGHNPCALASDVRRGPLSRAAETVARAGLEDKITLRLADGLAGAEDFSPQDIIIAGMGGELIASLLAAAPMVRSADVRLILQPMTHSDRLRAWLWSNGFTIEREAAVAEDRLYEIICAAYTGIPERHTPAEILAGAYHLTSGEENSVLLVRRRAAQLRKEIESRQRAGRDVSSELACAAQLEEALCNTESCIGS